MYKKEYDTIVSCVLRKGNSKQRKAVASLMKTGGYDDCHENKLKIEFLEKIIAKRNSQIAFLKRWFYRAKDITIKEREEILNSL